MSRLFGHTIRELRKARGETLADVAAHTGLSIAMISRVERGDRLPSAKSVEVLGRHFGFSAEELFGDIVMHKLVSKYGEEGTQKAAERIIRSTTAGSGSRPAAKESGDALDGAIRGMQNAMESQRRIATSDDTELKLRMIAGIDALCRAPMQLLGEMARTESDPALRLLADHVLKELRRAK